MPSRTVNYTLKQPDGDPWVAWVSTWQLLETFATSSETVVTGETITSTSDASGLGSVSLRVSDDGTVNYRVYLPEGWFTIAVGPGSATTLQALLLQDQEQPSASALAAHADTLAADDGTLGHIRGGGSGYTIDPDGTLQVTGGGGGGGGAPTDATYIVQTPNGSLSAEQALSALATGILKNTTSTGVLSIAAAGDLPAHSSTHDDRYFTEAEITSMLASYLLLANFTFANLGSKPTTLSGYGITDAASDTELSNHESDTTNVHGIADTTALITSAAVAAGYQPLDSDLTAIAALTTTSFGRALLALADAAAGRTAFGLGTAATADTGTGAANVPTITQADARYQPLDSDLTAIAALTTTSFGRSLLEAADAAALRTLAALGSLATQSSVTASQISDASANGRSLITAADYAAMRTLLGLVIGTNVQAYDAELAALAGLTSAADTVPYFTGSGAAALATLTSAARSLLDDTTTAAMLATLSGQLAIPQGRAVAGGTTYYIIPGVIVFNASTLVLTLNRIYYFPFEVFTTITIDQLAVEVTSAGGAGTVIHLYIYQMDTSHQPGNRVVDAGTVPADGATGVKTASVNQQLTPGLYCGALISDSTATLRTLRGSMLGSDMATVLGASPVFNDLRVAGSGTTIPDPGTAWNATNAGSGGINHMIAYRVSTP